MCVNVQLLGWVFGVFVFTQALYLVVNLAVAGLLYVRGVNLVPEEAPSEYPPINVLLAIRGERREILEETISELFEQRYPEDLIHVYVVYEEDDAVVEGYADELADEASNRRRSVTSVGVDRESLRYYLQADGRLNEGGRLPRSKAAALTYAFATLSFQPTDVMTVYDSDTKLPKDTFALAVRGLEEYDVVQAKQTVRNHASGWLPTLEAMGIAAWSHVIYASASKGPYQLLGKGYFIEVGKLYAIGGWDADAMTEDMTLGVEAYLNGYELGVIDRYVQDLCPPKFRDWRKQKRRWVMGPYEHLLDERLTRRDRLRFWTFTVANQMLSMTNVVGVPAGLFVLWRTLGGTPFVFPNALTVIVVVNFASWLYYSIRTYAATRAAVPLASRREKVRFYLLANPFTQVLYATIWIVPILGAMARFARDEEMDFEVTPK
jgi:cellulose synthase/poly-beta-1,6-N-acetylglucosamine synthase-like glycosyltransferase